MRSIGKRFGIWVFLAMAAGAAGVIPCPAAATPADMRNAADFPGASIVEQIDAAILNCGSAPCDVRVPAGTYEASAINTWMQRDTTGSRVGIRLPSDIRIHGDGEGHTVIRVTRGANDPPAILFANADAENHNIRMSDMTVIWTDASRQFDWVSILVCRGCDELELDHLTLDGNPNKLVNLLDNTHVNVHDNTFRLHSTSYGHGDNALSLNRFDPARHPGSGAGWVRNNRFIQIGDYRVFSMLAVTQSGSSITGNTFEAPPEPSGDRATGIETGIDNLGKLPSGVEIRGNRFRDASIAHGGMNDSLIADNFFWQGNIYIALQDGTSASLTGLTIARNEMHFGSIWITGLEHVSTSRCAITGNHISDGSIGVGNGALVQDIEVSDNTVRYSRNANGIDCNACSLIRGNVVQEIGQKGLSDMTAGFQIGGHVLDVSNNVYIDAQHDFGAGVICSVAKPTATLCQTSGQSRWVMLQDAKWQIGWTNRTLFTEHGDYRIRAFVNSSLLELDEDAAVIPPGTPFHLYRTTFNAFELNGAHIERFSNNEAISTEGAFRHAAIQEDGDVQFGEVRSNLLRPNVCDGRCRADYQGDGKSTRP
jgi:hypothetical protein